MSKLLKSVVLGVVSLGLMFSFSSCDKQIAQKDNTKTVAVKTIEPSSIDITGEYSGKVVSGDEIIVARRFLARLKTLMFQSVTMLARGKFYILLKKPMSRLNFLQTARPLMLRV